MYNPQLTRRDFLRKGAVSTATAVSGRLSDRLSAAIGSLGGLVGVVATKEPASSQDRVQIVFLQMGAFLHIMLIFL